MMHYILSYVFLQYFSHLFMTRILFSNTVITEGWFVFWLQDYSTIYPNFFKVFLCQNFYFWKILISDLENISLCFRESQSSILLSIISRLDTLTTLGMKGSDVLFISGITKLVKPSAASLQSLSCTTYVFVVPFSFGIITCLFLFHLTCSL